MSLSKQIYQLICDTKSCILDLEEKDFLLSKEDAQFFQKKPQLKATKVEKKTTFPKYTPPSIKPQVKNICFDEKKELTIPQKNSRLEERVAQKITTKEKENLPPQKAKFISLYKPEKKSFVSDEIQKIIKEISPHFEIVEKIPDDREAKQIAQAYKLKKTAADITILSFKESPQGILFLQNLAKALDVLFAPTKIVNAYVLEKDAAWDYFLSQNIKLIIACDYSIWNLANLIKYYRENKQEKTHYLKDTQLFMLPDISLYLKEPTLKKSLLTSLSKTIYKVKGSV